MEKNVKYVITVVIVIGLFTSLSSQGIGKYNSAYETIKNDDISNQTFEAENSLLCYTPNYGFAMQKMSSQEALENFEIDSIINSQKLADIPVITDENDIQNPTITTDESGNILIMAETTINAFESDLALRYSSDGGISWLPADGYYTFTLEGLERLPKLDYTGTSDFQAYGTYMADPVTPVMRLMHFPDMADPEAVWGEDDGWTIWSTDLSGSYEDFKGVDVAAFPHGIERGAPAPDFHGTIVWTSVDDSTGLDTFCILWETEDNGLTLIYMEDVQGEVNDIAADIDHSTGVFYEAIEWKDAPDFIEDGIFVDFNDLQAGNDDWWQDTWSEVIFEGYWNPDIAATSGNVYLVCQNEDFDIVCHYSHDGGQTFQSSYVTNTPVYDESNPSIYASGNHVVCSFFRGNNVHVAVSEDGGVTWDINDEQMNGVDGSAIPQYSNANIAGGYLAWADARGESTDIYFNSMPTPIISIEMSGGFGISASVNNIGSLAAENVPWSITVNGGLILMGGENSGEIASLPPGTTESISSGFMLGIGSITATVSAGGATTVGEGFLLGPLVLGM